MTAMLLKPVPTFAFQHRGGPSSGHWLVQAVSVEMPSQRTPRHRGHPSACSGKVTLKRSTADPSNGDVSDEAWDASSGLGVQPVMDSATMAVASRRMERVVGMAIEPWRGTRD